jgi:hypothetical protein
MLKTMQICQKYTVLRFFVVFLLFLFFKKVKKKKGKKSSYDNIHLSLINESKVKKKSS